MVYRPTLDRPETVPSYVQQLIDYDDHRVHINHTINLARNPEPVIYLDWCEHSC